MEVFDGTVWAAHGGKTDVIEKGGAVVIGNEDTDSPQAITSVSTASNNDEMPVIIDEPENDTPVLTISRAFADSADYRTAQPKKLDIYLYGIPDDRSTAITAETDTDKLSPLERSLADIDSRFIVPIIDRANLIYDEKKDEILEAYLKDELYKPTDITEFYADFTDRKIVVSDEASVLSFEFTRVNLDWIYAEYPPDIEHPILEPGYIDSEGRRYYIVGMTFTFFGNMNNGEEGAVSLVGET